MLLALMKSQPISPDQFNELLTLVIEVFDSQSEADSWLDTFNTALGDTPRNAAQSVSGLVEVKRILATISYGGVV